MKFTDSEKLIITMLAEIYEKLEVNGNVNHQLVKAAIEKNFLWAFNWGQVGFDISEQEPLPKEVVEVFNHLKMWSYIEKSYAELTQENKNDLEKKLSSLGINPVFLGYDKSKEATHYNILKFLFSYCKRFSFLGNRELNSHSPVLESYKRMWAVFSPMLEISDFEKLSIEQLALVLHEQMDPDSRYN